MTIMKGIIMEFVIVIGVEGNSLTYWTGVVVVKGVELLHVVAELHLLGKAFSTAYTSFVDVL